MALNLNSEIGASELLAGASILGCSADDFVNDSMIEQLWAKKAFDHAEIYFNLISSVDPKILRLTKFDDNIYKHFREMFPNLNVGLLTENELKTAEAKEHWRPFCETYKDTVEDYNYGTLFRLDSSKEYSESNSVVVPRVQFFALELARNREGFNDTIKEKFKPKKLLKS